MNIFKSAVLCTLLLTALPAAAVTKQTKPSLARQILAYSVRGLKTAGYGTLAGVSSIMALIFAYDAGDSGYEALQLIVDPEDWDGEEWENLADLKDDAKRVVINGAFAALMAYLAYYGVKKAKEACLGQQATPAKAA